MLKNDRIEQGPSGIDSRREPCGSSANDQDVNRIHMSLLCLARLLLDIPNLHESETRCDEHKRERSKAKDKRGAAQGTRLPRPQTDAGVNKNARSNAPGRAS